MQVVGVSTCVRLDHHSNLIAMTTTPSAKHAANTDIQVRPRRDAWNALRKEVGLTSDRALALRLGVAETTTYRVLSGAHPPSARFIALALVAFPFASFDRLFEVTR